MKIFISQTMLGKTDEEIIKEREKIMKQFNIEKDELIDSFIKENNKKPVEMLGKSIELLGKADLILIPKGTRSRGVEIEYQVSLNYGIPRIFY